MAEASHQKTNMTQTSTPTDGPRDYQRQPYQQQQQQQRYPPHNIYWQHHSPPPHGSVIFTTVTGPAIVRPPGGPYPADQLPPPSPWVYAEIHERPNPNVNNSLLLSLIALFCCFPMGVVAIALALVARSRLISGDMYGADKMHDWATVIALSAITFSVIGILLNLIMFMQHSYKQGHGYAIKPDENP